MASTATTADAILRALRELGGTARAGDIVAEVTSRTHSSDSTVRNVLSRLKDRGELISPQYGYYSLPEATGQTSSEAKSEEESNGERVFDYERVSGESELQTSLPDELFDEEKRELLSESSSEPHSEKDRDRSSRSRSVSESEKGEGERPKKDEVERRLQNRGRSEVESYFSEEIHVEVYTDVIPSPNGEGVIYREQSLEGFDLPRHFIEKIIGFAPPSYLGVHFVEGDTMEPTLEAGDMVLYEPYTSVKSSGGGLYVILLEGDMVAKRVQKVSGAGFRIMSDNKSWDYDHISLVPPSTEEREERSFPHNTLVHEKTRQPVDLRVAGEVLWPKRETAKVQLEHVAQVIQSFLIDAKDGNAEQLPSA